MESARGVKVCKKSTSAYTLIEILVSLTIIGVLFGVGYVSFRNFARRQAVVGAAKVLQGDLRLAQQMALSGTKPDELNCSTKSLDGIWFGITTSPPYFYRIRAICGLDNYDPTQYDQTNYPVIKEYYFPSELTPDLSGFTPNPLIFKVLGHGTNIPDGSVSVIKLTNDSNDEATITITSGGEIK